MPLVRIDLLRRKWPAYKQAICDGAYRAMLDDFAVPKHDRFMIVNEHDANNFVHAESYLGIAYTDGLIVIQITASDTRTVQQKQAFFARVAALLAENPVLRKEDVLSTSLKSRKRIGRLATASLNMR
jgi:4-oxalocrotonate tautomerase